VLRRSLGGWGALIGAFLLIAADAAHGAAGRAISAETLGVIVNSADSVSVAIADYYARRRGVPDENVIDVRFTPGQPQLTRQAFETLKAKVDARTPDHVQAYLLTWAQPFRVACMSITTAFAAGFDEAWCAESCKATRRSPYFDSDASRPHDDLRWRPTMSLAALDLAHARELIDRGVAADGTAPAGTGYLVSTSSRARNVRASAFPALVAHHQGEVALRYVQADFIEGRKDVLFYFTGAREVQRLDTNEFVPGAIADHLTSGGGRLVGGRQMSALRWLEAGATASYGTVAEPCNFTQKFPVPGIVIRRYLAGETLIEAYTKSVEMPGQGIFIGEPLSRPFSGNR
jgi:uncharacterized protein (TIGR03790 family)